MTFLRPYRGLLWIAAATVALCIFLALRMEVVTGIDRLIPDSSDPGAGAVVRAMADSERSRVLVLAIRSRDRVAGRRIARGLTDGLSKDDRIAWVECGPPAGVEHALDTAFASRRLLFVSDAPEQDIPYWFSNEGTAQVARRIREAVQGPFGSLAARYAPADPFLGFERALERIARLRPSGLRVEDGVYTDRKRRHAFVFVATKASAFDEDRQAPLLRDIERRFGELAGSAAHRPRLLEAGIHRFAVRGRESAEADVARVSMLSSILVVGLFLLVFPRVSLLANVTAIAGGAVAAGAAGVTLALGPLHVVTLGFGSTLLGVCIDYPIHWMNHVTLRSYDDAAGEDSNTWLAIYLGAATTFVGFAAMAATGLRGLQEIGVFGACGVVFATVMTRLAGPPVQEIAAAPTRVHRAAICFVNWLTTVTSARRLAAAVFLGALFVVTVVGVPRLTFKDDVLALSMVGPTDLKEEIRVRRMLGGPDGGRLIAAVAEDEERALAANDEIARRLDPLLADGRIGGYQSVHALLWSRSLQQRNWEALREHRQRVPDLFAALRDAGIDDNQFRPFADGISGAPPASLQAADLQGTPLQRMVDPFRIRVPGGYAFVTLLQGSVDADGVRAAIAGVPGASYVDQRLLVNDAYRSYRESAAWRLAIATATVLGLVALRLRSMSLTVLSCLPAIFAIGFTAGVLGLAGTPVNLMHMASLVLVLSMVVDYGIFVAVERHRRSAFVSSMVAVFLAGTTTIAVFAVLATSVFPAMRMIGVTTVLGTTAGFFATVALYLCMEKGADAASS